MLQRATQSVPAFVPEALAASQIGTWDYDSAADRLRCDEFMASLYGLTAREGVDGVPIARVSEALHPADRGRGRQKRVTMLEQGGLFVIEYRLAVAEAVRWVLVRGHYERDAAGRMHGRGIVIDITESKREGHAEDSAFFITPREAVDPLDRAARHALAARKAIDEVCDREHPMLRRTVDALLWSIGRALTRQNLGRGGWSSEITR